MKILRCLLLLASFAATSSPAAIPAIALKPVVLSQLDSPVCITNAGDGSGRLFVCEQRGTIRIVQNGMLLPQPFLDVSAKLLPERAGYDERGLLGLAFHPGFANSASPGYRKFYIFYTGPSPNAPGNATDPVDCRTTIAEYQVPAVAANVAEANSERVLLAFDKPQFNHNAGQLEFGPDGFLYASTGDGGGADDNDAGHTGGSSAKPNGVLGNAQDTTRLLGKILRIDPLGNNGPGGQYGIPAGNPFAGAGGGVRPEIYAFGLRNPWRFSFDAAAGRLICPDVGQARVEEINLITSGANCGWRAREGGFAFDATAPNGGLPLINPIAQYEHPGLNPSLGLQPLGISITGGYVYRASAFPELVGKYVFGDWGISSPSSGVLLGMEETAPNTFVLSKLTVLGGNPIPTHVICFGRDEAGELYVGTKTTMGVTEQDPNTGLPAGGIYKIVPPQNGSSMREPLKDNTIFANSTNNSDGQGGLTAGRIAQGHLRRGLIAFDLSDAVPAGASVVSAALSLNVTNLHSGATNFTLHKLGEDWGEGASNGGNTGLGAPAENNDATWNARFFDKANPSASVNWSTPGGAFVAAPSATANLNGLGLFTWSGDGLVADVQSWLSNPGQNFGWILRGEQVAGTTARRLSSGEASDASLRPKLTIGYASPPPLTRREQWLQQYFLVGQFVDDTADLDGDGIANLLEYAYAFSPLARNSLGAGLTISRAPAGANTEFTIVFRRDPRAIDLTYRLQTSDDFVSWSTIAESIAGATPSGSGFVSEAHAPGEAPVKLVTARETLATTKRFVRLRILRTP